MRLLKVDGDDLLLTEGTGDSLLLVEADAFDPANLAVTVSGSTASLSWDASPLLT